MEGAPSHVDTFDYKPKLADSTARACRKARVVRPSCSASPWKFAQHGQSGLWISELFPELAKQADELCLLRGMHTDVPAHPQAFLQMHTGIFQFKRPSMGAWALYGLGTENENLPGFVTISPPLQNGGPSNYGSAFLPAVYQGTPIRSGFRRSAEAAAGGPAAAAAASATSSNPEAVAGRPAACSSISSNRSTAKPWNANRTTPASRGPSSHSNSPSACRTTCRS